MSAYSQLEAIATKVYRLQHLLSLGHWDAQVMMPPHGVGARGEALAQLNQITHQHIVDPKVKNLIDEAYTCEESLNEVQRANLREIKRAYEDAAALPEDFVLRQARLTTKAHNVWKQSREENNFQMFLPVLKELIAMAREEARLRVGNSDKPLYEALLQKFEPGMQLATVDNIFKEVKSWLPQLLKQILHDSQRTKASAVAVQTPIATNQQEALCLELMRVWQFNFNAGRLDVSAHPFTGMAKEDCRITTRFNPDAFDRATFATIHETGHAKYEQNCGPREMITQPVCNARSLGVHESQSLFAEFQIGRSAAFAAYLTPKLVEYFGAQPAFTAGNVQQLLLHVEPGYIRVDADEVCYPLHVILRYEIERALLEGAMEAEDVPRVWDEKMQAYLGLSTEGKDNVGCLQDVHWSQGSFGYFPTYSLGAMFAAQLMHTIRKELGGDAVDACIRSGDLGPIFAKQKEKIWDHGCVYETEELMVKATGEPLNPKYFREHLENRYLRNKN